MKNVIALLKFAPNTAVRTQPAIALPNCMDYYGQLELKDVDFTNPVPVKVVLPEIIKLLKNADCKEESLVSFEVYLVEVDKEGAFDAEALVEENRIKLVHQQEDEEMSKEEQALAEKTEVVKGAPVNQGTNVYHQPTNEFGKKYKDVKTARLTPRGSVITAGFGALAANLGDQLLNDNWESARCISTGLATVVVGMGAHALHNTTKKMTNESGAGMHAGLNLVAGGVTGLVIGRGFEAIFEAQEMFSFSKKEEATHENPNEEAMIVPVSDPEVKAIINEYEQEM
ncbi:hypothetical protein D9_0203 [Aeromonas phage D9]|nr:hypothetical protein D9_0203 [Aeromonas phage D9]